MAAHARVHVQGCGLWSWVLVLGRGVSIWGLGVRVTWLHLSLSIRRPVCVYVRMYARMYVCMCVCMYVYLASHAPQHPSASGRILPTATQLVPRPPLEARVRCSTAPCPGHVCVCVCVYKFIYIYMTVRPPSRYTYMRYICTYTHTTQLGAARQHLVLALARCHQGMPHNRRRVINRRSMLGTEASCIAHHASRTHPHPHLQRGGSVAELLDAGRQGRDFAPHRVDFALQVLLQRLGGVAICGAASRITHHSLITPHPHHHRITPSSPSSPHHSLIPIITCHLRRSPTARQRGPQTAPSYSQKSLRPPASPSASKSARAARSPAPAMPPATPARPRPSLDFQTLASTESMRATRI